MRDFQAMNEPLQDFIKTKTSLTTRFCGLDRTRTCDLTDVNGAF